MYHVSLGNIAFICVYAALMVASSAYSPGSAAYEESRSLPDAYDPTHSREGRRPSAPNTLTRRAVQSLGQSPPKTNQAAPNGSAEQGPSFRWHFSEGEKKHYHAQKQSEAAEQTTTPAERSQETERIKNKAAQQVPAVRSHYSDPKKKQDDAKSQSGAAEQASTSAEHSWEAEQVKGKGRPTGSAQPAPSFPYPLVE